jgi:hypothetical protein
LRTQWHPPAWNSSHEDDVKQPKISEQTKIPAPLPVALGPPKPKEAEDQDCMWRDH